MGENPNIISHLLDIAILIAAAWAVNKMIKAKTGKSMFQRHQERMQQLIGEAEAKQTGDVTDDRFLLNKLCQITDMTILDVFLTARDEMGFGHSDEKVQRHAELCANNRERELPNYVEAFLEKGKDYILNA